MSKPTTHRNLNTFQSWHIAGLILLVSIVSFLGYAFWPQELAEKKSVVTEFSGDTPTTIEAIVIQKKDFPLHVEATGHLAPWQQAEISSETGGIIQHRFIEEGHFVKEGTLLVQLENREQKIAVAETEAELLKALAEYAVNYSQSGDAATPDTSRLHTNRLALYEAERAFSKGILTQAELVEARRRFETEEVLVGTQREAIRAATVGLTQAEQRLARVQLDLDRTRITAPFAGRISNLSLEVGQRISIGETLFTLLNDRKMKVEVDVLEADLLKLSKGALAWVLPPALDIQTDRKEETLRGNIYSINPFIDINTGTGRVTVALTNPNGRLITGMFAKVVLETETLSNRLSVPAEAVLERQGRTLVFRAKNNRAQWVYVTCGARSAVEIEVLEGLAAGDTIAVRGHFALAHDAAIEVILQDN